MMDERRVGRQEEAVGCVGDDALVAYVAGLLEGASLERVREHVARCEDCALLVAAAAAVEGAPSSGSGGAAAAQPARVKGAASQREVGRFDRRYELLEPIGRGAMGSVYRARDRETGATVAIKRLEHVGAKPLGRELARFLRESALLRRLAHPNIVRILETIDSGDAHQIVMEYLPGGSLRQRLDEQRTLSIEHALALLVGGWCLGKVRGSERCIADAERGLAMYRRTGSDWDVAFGLMLLARAYQRSANDNAQSEALLRESLALQRSAYGVVVIPGCLNRLASLRSSRGDWQGARHWAQEGLDTAERLGDVWTLQDSLQLAATARQQPAAARSLG